MPIKTRPLLRSFAGKALLLCCLILASCSGPAFGQASYTPEELRWWKPYLLYLLPSPCPRLYVEVEAVEGCAPDEAELQKLRGFLQTYCNKPGGIQIVRDKVIPLAAAKGLSASTLARKYMQGPDTNNASSSAYMYVLFYNDRGPSDHEDGVRFLPYPAMIYINPHYFHGMAKNEVLLHEAGHELGLVRRPDGADFHCPDPNCLMNKTVRVHIGRLLTFRNPVKQHELCEKCKAELAESSKLSPPANLRFAGPVLVRSEAGYSVLSLPQCAEVVLGNLTERDSRDFAADARALSSGEDEDIAYNVYAKDEVKSNPAKLAEMIDRAAADPYTVLEFPMAKFCIANGLFTNAVGICRRAILADPENDDAYNLLAWIKATCPDASIRDGKEAVSAATKACELTKWKDRESMDTLAAAYADSGDFKRAVEYEQRALRTGDLGDSEQKEMREHLSLYQHLQPLRDNPSNQGAGNH